MIDKVDGIKLLNNFDSAFFSGFISIWIHQDKLLYEFSIFYPKSHVACLYPLKCACRIYLIIHLLWCHSIIIHDVYMAHENIHKYNDKKIEITMCLSI